MTNDRTRQSLAKPSEPQTARSPVKKDRRPMPIPQQLKDALKQPPEQKLDLAALDVRQWRGSIQRDHAEEMLAKLEADLLPWLRVSEKLQTHVHMYAQSITLLQRKGDAAQTVQKLTKRVAPVISLKEDVDDFLSEECTRLLEIVEKNHELEHADE